MLHFHRGKQIGVIRNLPFDGGYGSQAVFAKELNDINNFYKYQIAIVANSCQSDCSKILKRCKFFPVVEFYSSHGNHETLTLLLKINEEAEKNLSKAVDNYGWNCSVCMDKRNKLGSGRNLVILPCSRGLIKEGYSRIENTPICFKVEGVVKVFDI